MVLNQFIDSINPDWIVLEMCANDFADNYWKLEEVTGYKVGERRPYMTLENRIEYHHPHYWLEDLKKYSVFLNFIFTKMRNALFRLKILPIASTADKLIAKKNLNYNLLAESYQLTENTLTKIDSLAKSRRAKLYVFVADDFQPFLTNINRICTENHIDIIDGIGQEVRATENGGMVVRAYDGYHWNNAGQKIVADKLIRYFRPKLQQ